MLSINADAESFFVRASTIKSCGSYREAVEIVAEPVEEGNDE
jgi:hypothetical protein